MNTWTNSVWFGVCVHACFKILDIYVFGEDLSFTFIFDRIFWVHVYQQGKWVSMNFFFFFLIMIRTQGFEFEALIHTWVIIQPTNCIVSCGECCCLPVFIFIWCFMGSCGVMLYTIKWNISICFGMCRVWNYCRIHIAQVIHD